MPRFAPIALLLLAIAPFAAADLHQSVKNRVSLTVAASEDVDNNLLVVRMFVQHDARQQSEASSRVNADMAWALETAKRHETVKSQTLDYRSDPVYQERRLQSWRTRQSLRLESTDQDRLTGLMGELQARLAIESVSYRVSDPVRERAEERLIAEAIERFTARSKKIAAAFGRPSYTLVNVNIDTRGGQPPPIAFAGRTAALQAEGAGPSIEAGVQSIEVTVNGTIELAP